MNQLQVKKSNKTAIAVAIVAASVAIVSALIACAYIFGGDPIKVSVTIVIAALPSTTALWFLTSLLLYIIGKYRGRTYRAVEVNLRISSLLVAALLFAAVVAMFISVIAFGVHPLEAISVYFK